MKKYSWVSHRKFFEEAEEIYKEQYEKRKHLESRSRVWMYNYKDEKLLVFSIYTGEEIDEKIKELGIKIPDKLLKELSPNSNKNISDEGIKFW